MTGKTKLDGQGGQVVEARNEVEGTREAESKVIPVQRNAFDPLKYLSEIDRRSTDFRGDVSKCPAAGQVAGEQHFDAVRQPARRMSRTGLV